MESLIKTTSTCLFLSIVFPISLVLSSCVYKSHSNRAGHFYVAQLEEHPPLFFKSKHQISMRAHSNLAILLCISFKMFNTNPFHRLPPASFYSSFSIRLYQRPQQGSVVWVDGVPQRKSWSLVAVFFCLFFFCLFFLFFKKKHLWHLIYFCLFSQSFVFTEKFGVF